MATTTGSEYDHITISDGTNQTVHYLKDTAARADLGDLKSAVTNNLISLEPYVVSNVTNFTFDDWELGGIDSSGKEFSASYIMRTKAYYPYNPDATYVWADRTSDATTRFAHFYDADMVWLARDANSTIHNDNAKYVRFTYGYTSTSGVTIDSALMATLAAAFGYNVTPEINPTEVKNAIKYVKNHDKITRLTDAAGSMIAVAETYFNVAYDPNDSLVYSSTHGPYTTPLDDNDKKATACSQFVKSVITGTLYGNSKYVDNANYPSWWGYEYDGTTNATYEPNNYLTAKNIAKYCQDKGWLIPYDPAHNNVHPGDLLFFEENNAVTHVAIAVAKRYNGLSWIEANSNITRYVDGAGVGLRLFQMSNGTQSMCDYYAHLPIPASQYTVTEVTHKDGTYSGTYSSSSAQITGMTFTTPLPIGFYTLCLDDVGNSTDIYVKINPLKNNENVSGYRQGKYCYVVFYAQYPIEDLNIRCSGGTTYNANNIVLYKGYYPYDGL